MLLGAAELYQWATHLDWLQHLSLPMPIFILGGAGLAIASNYSKKIRFISSSQQPQSQQAQQGEQQASAIPATDLASHPSQLKTPQLPSFEISKPQSSISFTIRQAERSPDS